MEDKSPKRGRKHFYFVFWKNYFGMEDKSPKRGRKPSSTSSYVFLVKEWKISPRRGDGNFIFDFFYRVT